MEYKKIFVEQIHIPKETRQNSPIMLEIENLVDEIQKAKNQNSETDQFEDQIDTLVYDLYGLTNNERNIMANVSKQTQ
ncbi:MAG: hypothetical protein OXE97_09260 [Gammaproteobacteria bacterium]|nr:hypothetical protein [Gammaproteobacteria bacterium]MCY4303465.1 hypothetical protein [Aestuariivita sp.]